MSEFAYESTYTFTTGILRKAIVSEMESGVKQIRSKWGSSLRSWRLQYIGVSQATIDAIVAFFESKGGQETSFTWTNPLNSTEYTVRFSVDELKPENVGYDNWNLEVELEQVK